MAIGIIPEMNEKERALLESLNGNFKLPGKHLKRVQAVLGRADGIKTSDLARILRVDASQISRWVKKYIEEGIDVLLQDKTRPPRIPPVSLEVEKRVCRITVQEKPKNATHWSTRAMAKRVGLSHNKVAEIWRKYDLKPHLVKTFKYSNDPEFETKMADVVGLYLNQPKNAVVFCVDEKTQIQALQRSQPLLPLKEGAVARQTHDYYRHGTTTLFAALNVMTGKVIGECKKRHTAADFLDFMEKINKSVPKKYNLHIVLDNVSSHKTKAVKEYLKKNPRIKFHFTPTSCSWLNLVERWFAEITTKRIRRESWNSVKHLKLAILAYIRNWNKDCKPFVWTKTPEQILEKINAFS